MPSFKSQMKSILNKSAEEVRDVSERLAIATYGPLSNHTDDPCPPPSTPTQVECLHCKSVYMSDEMQFAYRPYMQAHAVNAGVDLEPLWWCKDRNCEGAGFGYDIHPTGQEA